MDWQVEYYKKKNGDIPVLDFLLSLETKMRAKAFNEIELLEKHGPELKEPYVKPVKGEQYKGLFELKIKFASNISRIFYFTYNEKTFVLLHGFTKKTKKTPPKELVRALRYKEDYERRCDNE
jgi:phage-related protein